jgi:hypothetical protein
MKLYTRTFALGLAAVVSVANAQQTQTNQQSAEATVNTNVVVSQPTTVVEATPLEDSKAERLRKARQEREVETEQKIVEKLEESRLEDEKKRAEKLFGGKLEKEEEKAEAAPVAPPVYTEHQMPQQQVVISAPEEKKVTADDLENTKKEILDAVKAEQSVKMEAPKVEKPSNRYYISGLIGTADYPSAANIEGKGAGGILVGAEMPNDFMVEGGLLYSNYFIDDFFWVTGDPIFKEMDQYNLGLAVKYSPLSGRFKPIVGASANYTYRKYFDRAIYTWQGVYLPNESEATTSAFDLGFLAGLEIGISDGFSIGIEYRYNTNLIYRSDSEIIDRMYRAEGSKLVEETAYSLITVGAKVMF